MARRIPQDHNYHTACPAAIKAKITALENTLCALDLSFAGSQADQDAAEQAAQTARYDLERTILTCIEAALKEMR